MASDTDSRPMTQFGDAWLLSTTDTSPPKRALRLLPDVTTRQLVTIIGFAAVIAYIAIALLAFTLLVTTPIGHTFAVEVAAAGLGSGIVCGLVGIVVWSLLRRRRRAGS